MKWSPLYYWYIANTAKTPNNQSVKLNEMDGIFYGRFFLSVNMTDHFITNSKNNVINPLCSMHGFLREVELKNIDTNNYHKQYL